MNEEMMHRGIELLLTGMGLDLSDQHYKDTPRRVTQLYKELFAPRSNNMQAFLSKYNSMIILRGHKVRAVCPHHLQIVELTAFVGYIPEKKVLGLSKLARAVDEHLTAPILQEELSDKVADTLNDRLEPKGVAVVLTGQHGCMRHRGVRTDGDIVTSAMRGVFLTFATPREEFLRLCSGDFR